jgi:hypothetical protein
LYRYAEAVDLAAELEALRAAASSAAGAHAAQLASITKKLALASVPAPPPPPPDESEELAALRLQVEAAREVGLYKLNSVYP